MMGLQRPSSRSRSWCGAIHFLVLSACVSPVSCSNVYISFALGQEAAESHWSGHAAAAMEDLVLSDKSLDLTIEGFSWSGNSVANELDFVTQVIKDAAADNTSVLIWQPVDRNASAPAAVLAVNAGLKLLWVDEFVVGYQNNGIALFGPDHKHSGMLAGRQFCEITKAGDKVAIMTGDPAERAQELRVAGLYEGINQYCPTRTKDISYKFVSESRTRTDAFNQFGPIFVVDTKLKAVITTHDNLALGVIDAAQSQRRKKLVGLVIGGIGGVHEAKAKVMAHEMDFSVDMNGAHLGRSILRTLRRYFLQGKLPSVDLKSRTKLVLSDPLKLLRAKIFARYSTQKIPYRTGPDPYDNSTENMAHAGMIRPVEIKLKAVMRQILTVSTLEQSFTALFYWKYAWIDERLSYELHDLDGVVKRAFISARPADIWLPDVMTMNGEFTTIQDVIRIKPKGVVEWPSLVKLVCYSDFDLRMFPFDIQTFTLGLESMSYPVSVVDFAVMRGFDLKLPINKKLGTPVPSGNWKWNKPFVSVKNINVSYWPIKPSTTPRVFKQWLINFHMQRDPSSYFFSFCLPLNMITLVSWCAMYLDPSDSNGLNLILTTMLVSMSYMYILSDSVPKTPFITWLGWYVIAFVLLNFYAAFEVIYMKSKCEEYVAAKEAHDSASEGDTVNGLDSVGMRAVQEEKDKAEAETASNVSFYRFNENVPVNARSLRKCSRHTFGALIFWINLLLFSWGLFMFFGQPKFGDVFPTEKHHTQQ